MGGTVERLKRRVEFLRVAGAGQKAVTPGLILQTRRRRPTDRYVPEGCGARVGFTVSRKVGKAVVRNRVRRRLRAVADDLLSGHADPRNDYVLIGRAGTLGRAFGLLVDDLAKSLRRLGVWRDGAGENGGDAA